MKIAIVGAGIIGRLLAWQCLQQRWSVCLYDATHADEGDNCSQVAAGMLTPTSELAKSDVLIYQLGTEAIACHWPRLLAALEQTALMKQTGVIVVAHPAEQAELIHFEHSVRAKSAIAASFIRAAELATREPSLVKFSSARYIAHEAYLDNQTLMKTLHDFLLKNNCEWQSRTVVETVQPHRVTIKGCHYAYDWVMDCRGLGAKNIFPTLQAVRGELLWLHAPEVILTHPIRFLHPRYSIYVTPRDRQHYIIGASEIHSADQRTITVRSALELLTAAYSLHPGFAEASIVKMATQLRPTLPNYLPCIQYADGLIAVNGLYRHGFLIAPTLAHDVIQFLTRGKIARQYPTLWKSYYDHCAVQ